MLLIFKIQARALIGHYKKKVIQVQYVRIKNANFGFTLDKKKKLAKEEVQI